MNNNIEITHEHVKNTWQKAVVEPKDTERPDLYVAPFVPPCVTGLFRVLFYWDTFYTNKGLILDGFPDLAKDNVDNLLAAVERNGYVPNALSESGTKWCSQPPYLYAMVRDIFATTGDKEWLKNAYFQLKREHNFWMTERITPIGLNRHYHLHAMTTADGEFYYDYVADVRLAIPKDIPLDEKLKKADNLVASAEAGLDWSPRFRMSAAEFCPVDQNANLYGMEKYLYELACEFEPEQADYYKTAFETRKTLMDKYMLGEDGLYYDFNYVKMEKNVFYSSGQFMPFVTGVTRDGAAALKLLGIMEQEFGITSTQEDHVDGLTYQWSFPNSWAPDNYLAYVGLKNCALDEDARRVAEKYLNNVAATYVKTDNLWEKYDGVCGGSATKTEHAMTEMLGWSGGVFTFFYYELKK